MEAPQWLTRGRSQPCWRGKRVRNPTHRRAFGEAGRQFNFPEDTSEGARARSRHLTQHGMGRAASWHGSSDLHHIQPMAHANSRALSRHAPRTGDKGLGRNGIPKPAGAGGGSSSLSLELFEGLMRFIHLESTLRLRPEGCSRLPFSLRSSDCSSSKTSARRIASTSTTAPLSSRRNEGALSSARASEIHDARTAFFSAVVSFCRS